MTTFDGRSLFKGRTLAALLVVYLVWGSTYLGIRIAMDDFGTGYSSLAYLRRFPIDSLKIARELIAGPSESDDPEAWAFARAIIALGNSLGLPIVAEGIETPEQLRVLRRLGCELGQGFLFGQPMSAADLEPYLLRSVGTQASA